MAVYEGYALASASGKVVLEMNTIKSAINRSSITVLAESEPFPHLPWAAKADLNPALLARLQQLLFALPTHKPGLEILRHAEINRFEPATNASFDRVREIVRKTLGEEY